MGFFDKVMGGIDKANRFFGGVSGVAQNFGGAANTIRKTGKHMKKGNYGKALGALGRAKWY